MARQGECSGTEASRRSSTPKLSHTSSPLLATSTVASAIRVCFSVSVRPLISPFQRQLDHFILLLYSFSCIYLKYTPLHPTPASIFVALTNPVNPELVSPSSSTYATDSSPKTVELNPYLASCHLPFLYNSKQHRTFH